MDKLSIPYDILVPDIDESLLPSEGVEEHILRLSKEKALKVAMNLPKEKRPALVIACDSVCILNGEIMSKPETHENAVRQLESSSGKIVYFYSGLTLYNTHLQTFQQEVVKTEVHFKHLSNSLIQAYLEKDKPYHCAGSLRAEGLGIILIEKMIADDPNSLVGLPLISLVKMLENEGFYCYHQLADNFP
ncbi:MAG: Maf family nucleotide pyrophosphatase [Gammaproteobacteria bacterium]|nr:Maf family nucleotide pyrophosphatase [Gammaproteobacteria bacterium]MCD8543108.1 Maf family nucleotide pyrophosphatase [Gammaproteobacteria bacterium]